MKRADTFLSIRGSDNPFDMQGVAEEQTSLMGKHFMLPVHMQERLNNTRWCVLRYPNPAMAQLAEQPTETFADFYFDVCCLDYAKMSKAMDPLAELIERTDRVRIAVTDTPARMPATR